MVHLFITGRGPPCRKHGRFVFFKKMSHSLQSVQKKVKPKAGEKGGCLRGDVSMSFLTSNLAHRLGDRLIAEQVAPLGLHPGKLTWNLKSPI